MYQVRKTHSGANLLILGSGQDEDMLKMRAGSGVLFAGKVENVADYLKASDLFVLPSATEGLSNSLLEAMSTGLAVIATRVGGAVDVIDHQQSGWLVTPDQPASLQNALIALLEDKARRTQYGEKARTRIMQDYALETVASRLRELYERVSIQ